MKMGLEQQATSDAVPNGTVREFDGQRRVFYDGYWIKWYEPPADTLTAKKRLIQALTRRLFNHMEPGINIPGSRLEEIRSACESEQDPARQRVKRAMLAGALFNRAADIFTKLVELEACGVAIGPDNELMQQCGMCLRDALDLGRSVRHRSGDEGIDELWGEPFKAFTMPIEAFYESRYIKMAMTMRNIDRIVDGLQAAFAGSAVFAGVGEVIDEFARAAKRKCETLRTDGDIFNIWPAFVVAGERMVEFPPRLPPGHSRLELAEALEGVRLLKDGQRLVSYVTRARTPMPKSTEDFLELCESHRQLFRFQGLERTSGG
jgi:hypothetical protein